MNCRYICLVLPRHTEVKHWNYRALIASQAGMQAYPAEIEKNEARNAIENKRGEKVVWCQIFRSSKIPRMGG